MTLGTGVAQSPVRSEKVDMVTSQEIANCRRSSNNNGNKINIRPVVRVQITKLPASLPIYLHYALSDISSCNRLADGKMMEDLFTKLLSYYRFTTK